MTSRDELLNRYRDLSAKGAAQVAEASDVEILPPGATYVHEQAIELLDELLSIVPSDAGISGKLVTALRRAKPMLLRDFAKVPPDQIILFCHELAARMRRIGEPPIEAGAAADARDAGEPESASA